MEKQFVEEQPRDVVAAKEAQLIFERLAPLFEKRVSRTQYWLGVVNEKYSKRLNFFFNSSAPHRRKRSIPLHSLEGEHYDLAFLEQVLKVLREKTQLTIDFVGFEDKRWPSTDRPISNGRNRLER